MANEHFAESNGEHYLIANQDNQKRWAQLVTKAWADDALKQRLLNDPAPLLQEYGIDTPAGVEISVVQDDHTIACMLQPQEPAVDSQELSLSELSGVVGGGAKQTPNKSSKDKQTFLTFTMSQQFTTSM